MAIADSTLAQNTWTDVKATLVASSITTSILSGSTTTSVSANITGDFPDSTISKPQIVILPVFIDESDYKFGGSYGKRTINVVIEVYARRSKEVDELADKVRESLKGNALDGLNLMGISEDYAFTSPGDVKTHLKTLTFSYERESHA